jgi:hypothetical protein
MLNSEASPRSPEGSAAEPDPNRSSVADSSSITSVTFRLRPQDVRALRAATQPRFVLAIIVVLFVFLVVLSLTGLVLSIRRFGFRDPNLFKMASPLAVIVVVGGGTILWQRWHKWTEAPHEVRVELTPDGLNVRQAGVSEVKHAWTHIAEIRERPGHFLVYLKIFDPFWGREKPVPIIPIPRRAFATPEAADAFLRTAREWHTAAMESVVSRVASS